MTPAGTPNGRRRIASVMLWGATKSKGRSRRAIAAVKILYLGDPGVEEHPG